MAGLKELPSQNSRTESRWVRIQSGGSQWRRDVNKAKRAGGRSISKELGGEMERGQILRQLMEIGRGQGRSLLGCLAAGPTWC